MAFATFSKFDFVDLHPGDSWVTIVANCASSRTIFRAIDLLLANNIRLPGLGDLIVA